MQIDVVIFGGGIAGLWILDELHRRGYSVLLLESRALGAGQTVASQGIIHGGLKYTLSGWMTRSAVNVREMPGHWRQCLAGEQQPQLGATQIRSGSCLLWRTESLRSRLGMIGAKFGLQVVPRELEATERPEVLANCPGSVAALEEPVIDVVSLLNDFAGLHRKRIVHVDGPSVQCTLDSPGRVKSITFSDPNQMRMATISPSAVIFAAGAGNAELRSQVGLDQPVMQRRPLHMVMVRGELPELFGHCVDGAKTRVTVTSATDSSGRRVWQVGGQIAELGVQKTPDELVRFAREELQAAIPGIDLSQAEWATYRIDRAERRTEGGRRPDSVQILSEGNTLTVWPTKLALAPVLAQDVAEVIPDRGRVADLTPLCHWPRPPIAEPPWERADWKRLDEFGSGNKQELEKTPSNHRRSA